MTGDYPQYLKGAQVLHFTWLSQSQSLKDDFFVEHEVHYVAIASYGEDETLIFYLDEEQEIIDALDATAFSPLMAISNVEDQFKGLAISWVNL